MKRQRFPSLKAGTLSPETYLYKVSREIPKYRAATRMSMTSGISCILSSTASPAPSGFFGLLKPGGLAPFWPRLMGQAYGRAKRFAPILRFS